MDGVLESVKRLLPSVPATGRAVLVSPSASTVDLTGRDYTDWQQEEIKFHLFVERSAGCSSVSDVAVLDEEVIGRRGLDEWLRRKNETISFDGGDRGVINSES